MSEPKDTEKTKKIAKDGREMSPNSLKNLKMWKKGESGNPNGPPKGYRSITACMRKFLEIYKTKGKLPSGEEVDIDGYEAIALKLINMALTGNRKAINQVLDRLEGKPIQSTKNVNAEATLDELKESLEPPE